jgi:Uma2 family endonuclease
MSTTKLWTAEEIEALPETNESFELWHGEVKTVSPAGGRHGVICLRIGAHLERYASDSGIGAVLSNDPGFVLGRDPDVLLGPDVAVVAAKDLPLPDGYVTALPLLVVEVISPSDRMADVEAKVSLYRGAGVPSIWTVIPSARLVHVDGAGRDRRTRTAPEALQGDDGLPGMPPLLLDTLFQ